MNRDRVLTGIRSNGEPHIGNYLGAILPMVEIQKSHGDTHDMFFFVPDLHSFTTPIDHNTLYEHTVRNLKYFVAAGMNFWAPGTYVYRQSYIPAHSELTWILDCFTGFGEAKRMTQFKDKSQHTEKEYKRILAAAKIDFEAMTPLAKSLIELPIEKSVSVGLFNYPILMAADILLYNARYIPLGDDQKQHLELARDLGIRMNNKFESVFPDGVFTTVPEDWKKQLAFAKRDNGVRIRSLRNPEKKMSKSVDDPAGTINMTDDPTEAAKKIMSATTDSLGSINFDWEKQPGITNLLQILALMSERPMPDITEEWKGKNNYGDLKKAVAEKVEAFLRDFQARVADVDEAKLLTKLEKDEREVSKIAEVTLLRAQRAVGLRPQLSMSDVRFIVEQEGERVDAFLASIAPEHSRAYWQKRCEHDAVTVNGKVAKTNYKLHLDDIVEVTLPAIPDFSSHMLPVLYEDDDVLVINKPAGTLTHAKGAESDEFSVAEFVRPHTTDGIDTNRPGIVHRLDRGTSGIIIAAKKPEAKRWLQGQFSKRNVKKTYFALIEGHLREPEAILRLPIERNPKKPQTFRIGVNGKSAETAYRVEKRYKNYDLVELKPLTGRTHQLRVHLRYVGHPIVGDVVYGQESKELGRMFLHAYSLELTLPSRHRKVFTAPLPPELQNYLKTLE